jgi:hypothetical protein
MAFTRPTSHLTTLVAPPEERSTASPRHRPLPKHLQAKRHWPPPYLALGVIAGLATICLRYAGVLEGPLVVLLVLACTALAPGPKRLSLRILFAFAVVFGWLPLLGWIPSLGTALDVPGFALAIVVTFTCSYQVKAWKHSSRRTVSVDPSEGVGLTLAVIAGTWWASPFFRLQLARQLAFLMRGWDNATHFQMFRSNLQLGSFIAARRTVTGGGLRLDWDYPQGMHQAFAQLVRLWTLHPSLNTTWLLHAYITMLFVTEGLIIAALSMCIARACNGRALVAIPGMAVVLGLFAFGPFQLLNGYPNFDLGVAAAAIGTLSVLPSRHSPRLQFFLAGGMLLVDVYAWYPLALLVAPAAVLASVRLWRASSGATRGSTAAAVGFLAFMAMLPGLGIAHRGVRTLALAGGGIQASWGRLVFVLTALAVLVVYRHVRSGDRTTGLALASPVILGGPVLVLLIGYELTTQRNAIGQHVVGYYGQKFGLGLFGVTILVLTGLAATLIAREFALARLSSIAKSTLVSVAFIGLLQIFGYVGPLSRSLQGLETAPGLTAHNALSGSTLYEPQAAQLVAATHVLRAQHVVLSTDARSQWWFINPAPHGFDPDTNFALYAMWFDMLATPDPTIEHNLPVIALTPKLEFYKPSPTVARDVVSTFNLVKYPNLHLFVPTWLQHAIERIAPDWSKPGVLIAIPKS